MSKAVFDLTFTFVTLGLLLSGQAITQEPIYKGKTIRMLAATSAAGGFDTYTRTLARHFGKQVPRLSAGVFKLNPVLAGKLKSFLIPS